MTMDTVAVEKIANSWSALTDMARSLLDEQDRQRWQLGEIVDTVETYYDDNSIIKFCEEVKANPKTMYQYRAVYRFYPKGVWHDYPMVRYTQWRDAMRLKDVNAALDLLARFNDKNMRMVDFYNELKAMLGTNSTAEKVFDGMVTVNFNDGIVTFDVDALLTSGAVYHVTIKEA
jgi:hypothetical protein